MNDTAIIVATIAFLGTIITAAVTLLGIVDRSFAAKTAQHTSRVETTLSSISALADAEQVPDATSVIVGTAYGLIKLDQTDLALALVRGKLASGAVSQADAMPVISLALESDDDPTRVLAARLLRDNGGALPLTDTGEIIWPEAISLRGWSDRFAEPVLRYILEASQAAFVAHDFNDISQGQLHETVVLQAQIARSEAANDVTRSMALHSMTVLLPYMEGVRYLLRDGVEIEKSDLEELVNSIPLSEAQLPKSELHRLSLLRAQVQRAGLAPVQTYARLLGEKPERVSVRVEDGLVYFEGDIILGTADEVMAKAQAHAEMLAVPDDPDEIDHGVVITGINPYWPDLLVPYEMQLDPPLQALFDAAMSLWQDRAGVRFVLRDEGNHARYPNYIRVSTGPRDGSYLGMRGGIQHVHLREDIALGDIVHLLGHTLGLGHEHTRRDRDAHLVVLWNNISRQHLFEFEENQIMPVGAYDPASVMHAPEDASSRNGAVTLVPLSEQVIGTDDRYISAQDVAKIAILYKL